jgi:predicted phage terminase large subunit-like protein
MTERERKKRLEFLYRQAAEKKALIDKLEARECYWKYVRYTHAFDKEFKIAKFQVYICDCIDKLLRNELLNDDGEPYEGMTISMPGQCGKSRCVTETLPSYFLGKNPFKHVIEVSYNEDFAEKFGRRNKEKIIEFGKELFNIEISPDKAAATEFELKKTRGGMMSKGFGGGISGNPGDLIIIDDPYKNRQDADSPSYKKFVIDEWLNVIRIRASATCKYIVIHTRWNEDDLIGYLLDTEPEKWFKISFPLEAEDNEEITGRKPGDALLPEAGKDNKWLKRYKTSFMNDPTEGGVRAWNALMQQRPTSVEGNMIKRKFWQRYKLSLEMQKGKGFDQLIQSWDCSFKDTDGSDFVAGGVLGRIGPNCYLLDLDYERKDIVKTMQSIDRMTKKWPKAIGKYIEDKANGPAVITMMRTKLPGLIPVTPAKGKGERVNAVLPLWEAGNVYIPEEIEVSPGVWRKCLWANTVIEQCAAFRPEKKTQKDDIVDMCTQGLSQFMYVFIAPQERELNIGYASEEELKDMGVISMAARRPRKTVIGW